MVILKAGSVSFICSFCFDFNPPSFKPGVGVHPSSHPAAGRNNLDTKSLKQIVCKCLFCPGSFMIPVLLSFIPAVWSQPLWCHAHLPDRSHLKLHVSGNATLLKSDIGIIAVKYPLSSNITPGHLLMCTGWPRSWFDGLESECSLQSSNVS